MHYFLIIPTRMTNKGESFDDDLTFHSSEIIKANNLLKNSSSRV